MLQMRSDRVASPAASTHGISSKMVTTPAVHILTVRDADHKIQSYYRAWKAHHRALALWIAGVIRIASSHSMEIDVRVGELRASNTPPPALALERESRSSLAVVSSVASALSPMEHGSAHCVCLIPQVRRAIVASFK
jgi:hypothetical protein